MLRDGANCSHMVGVCTGVRHTCGFTNNRPGEHFCTGNTCSFPLMVRCSALLLHLEMLYAERSVMFEGQLVFVVSLGFVQCLLLVITNWELWWKAVLSLGVFWPFSFLLQKNKFIISNFSLWCSKDGAELESVVCRPHSLPYVLYDLIHLYQNRNYKDILKPCELKRGFWVF